MSDPRQQVFTHPDEASIDLAHETDPLIWSREFCKMFPCMDEGVMFAWFANSMRSPALSKERDEDNEVARLRGELSRLRITLESNLAYKAERLLREALEKEYDEAIAKCASIAPAIDEFLAWENSGDHTDAEWLEQTEKLAKLANAVKEPT